DPPRAVAAQARRGGTASDPSRSGELQMPHTAGTAVAPPPHNALPQCHRGKADSVDPPPTRVTAKRCASVARRSASPPPPAVSQKRPRKDPLSPAQAATAPSPIAQGGWHQREPTERRPLHHPREYGGVRASSATPPSRRRSTPWPPSPPPPTPTPRRPPTPSPPTRRPTATLIPIAIRRSAASRTPAPRPTDAPIPSSRPTASRTPMAATGKKCGIVIDACSAPSLSLRPSSVPTEAGSNKRWRPIGVAPTQAPSGLLTGEAVVTDSPPATPPFIDARA
ncbi:hypothetical protein BU14_0072s0020, partial [Porphyra umbilicalis]